MKATTYYIIFYKLFIVYVSHIIYNYKIIRMAIIIGGKRQVFKKVRETRC